VIALVIGSELEIRLTVPALERDVLEVAVSALHLIENATAIIHRHITIYDLRIEVSKSIESKAPIAPTPHGCNASAQPQN
jgi:hypothetical protein